jgi:hypothetical protein
MRLCGARPEAEGADEREDAVLSVVEEHSGVWER